MSSCLAISTLASWAQTLIAPVEIPVVPPSLWQSGGEGITLSEQDGVLAIHFDVEIERSQRIQHLTVLEESRLLELAEPVPIGREYERIFFDARGQDGSAESRRGTVFLRPVIEDENGERFSYEPYRMDTVQFGGAQDWTAWSTRPFWTSEAGGASPNIYVASGGDGNAWPDGKLHLIGFELRLRANHGGTQPGRQRGTLFLTDVRLASQRAEVRESVAFLDAFLQEKGEYRAAFEIRPAFQALPVGEFVAAFSFDPARESSRRQRVEIPFGSEMANSWIRYRFTDAEGGIAAEGDLRWEINRPPESTATLAFVDAATRPAIGQVRINPDRFTNGVYPAEVAPEITLRIFDPAPAEVRWELQTYAFRELLTEGVRTLSAGQGGFQDVVISLETPEDQTAFRFVYSLVGENGRELDRGSFVFGQAGDIEPNRNRNGVIPDREKIKEKPYNRITFHDGNSPVDSADVLTRFVKTLEEAGDFTTHVTFMMDLANFEILPGVYDFRILDQIMDAAADRRFGVTVRLAHAETKVPYQWLPYARVRDFDGSVIGGHYIYKAFSMADGSYMNSWVQAFRAMHERYREHPAFEGYYLMMPNGEWILPEEVWHGKIADYSWGAKRAFRNYLRTDLGLTLEDLNQHWGTSLSSWEEVDLPLPDWSRGSAPDLRPQWKDFNRFKLMLNNHWCRELGRRIREFDSQRVIISYGSPVSLIAEDGSKSIDYAHNGGNQFLRHEGHFVKAWDEGRGIGWITEPHHPHRWAAYGDPGQKGWVLDWSVFVMLAQAGGGGANLHVYYYPNPSYSLLENFGGEYSYDRLLNYKSVLRELHGLKIVTVPKQVAAFHDPATIFAKHRTTFEGRTADMTRWFELLTTDSVPWEFYAADQDYAYKVMFLNPLDEVLSADSLQKIHRFTRGGGTLVLCANTGRYNADDPAAVYPLLEMLGIEKPAGTFSTQVEGVAAVVLPTFQKALERETIPFYSQADMRREIQDPGIGEDFHRWPYCWLPQSDYFGYFRDNRIKSGEVLARFPDGGVAFSRHPVGKGTALVFWGTPDMTPERAEGFLGAIAKMSGVTNPQAGNAIPYMLEGKHQKLNRHYALLYQDTPGTYRQKLPNTPDGDWFIDDMVSSQRLGTFSGSDLRENGIEVTFQEGVSPLKVLRLNQPEKVRWQNRYPDFTTTKTPATP